MRFEFPRQRRRRKAVEAAFPQQWRDYLDEGMFHWRWLDTDERTRLEDLIKGFLHDKRFEWSNGLVASDQIRVLVAGSACLLILGLEKAYFRDVSSIIMYPTGVVIKGRRGSASVRGLETESIVPILGEAALHGPMVIVWDSAQRAAADPDGGHNVIYHEFAHKIDMADGSADGLPPMDRALRDTWAEICSRESNAVRDGTSDDLLSDYAGVNRAEFFAVATELFLDRPIDMEMHKPDLYGVLQGFYQQDPAARARRHRGTHSV